MSIITMIDRLLEGMDEQEVDQMADRLAGQMDPRVFANAMAQVPPSEAERMMNAPVQDYSQVQVKPYPAGSPYQNQLAPLKQPLEVNIGGGMPQAAPNTSAQKDAQALSMALQAYGQMGQSPNVPQAGPVPMVVRAGSASPANAVVPELYKQNAQGVGKIPSLAALLAGGGR